MSTDRPIIQVAATFTGFGSRADGGATMRFATQELNDVDFGMLKRMHNTFGYVLFSANELKEEDIPQADAEDESKSPSQRLRAVLFVLWKARGEQGDFNQFYRQEMERAIDKVKKLIELEGV